MAQRVKMSEIAEASGVSVSTVSLVLRNKPGIPLETRQRVLDIAKELGYSRKSAAAVAAPPGSKLRNLGLIIKMDHEEAPQTNPFYSQILAGVEYACRRKKINLLFASLLVDDKNYPVEVPHLIEEESIDGVLLVGALVDGALSPVLAQKPISIVLVDAYAPSGEYDAVVSDNLRGAYQAVSYLIKNGHRHIALVGACADAYPSLRERREGYLQALKEHGITQHYCADCLPRRPQALAATMALLEQHPKVTALFGCNDEVALAAMQAAQALGRRVPQDLSVVGFDDIDLAQHVTPPLTTMEVDKVQMGQLAVQMLETRVEFPDMARVTTVISPRLIERSSVQGERHVRRT